MVININAHPVIPALPRVNDKTKVDIRYSLTSPYANAHISWNQGSKELVYEVEEPFLDSYEKDVLEKLEKGMTELVNVNLVIERTPDKILDYIDKTARLLIKELNIKISMSSYEKLSYYLYRNFVGFNEVDSLLNDYFIEDIECNGVDTPIYIVHRIYRNIRTNVKFDDIETLASFVEKLSQRAGRHISYAQPLLDGTLSDGSRVNATYTKDITSRGPTFTIRKFTRVPWTPTQLIALNTLSPEMLAYFWILLQYKSNIFIIGGTASGKTTLLNALAFFIPPESRVVSIEDTRELNLPRENWIPSVARTSIGVGKIGEVDLFDLLKNSFRQNPDYVIVGEVRGKEAFVLFQGMASGHPSMGTIHADSLETMIRRLQTPPISLSPSLVNTLDCVTVISHAIVKKKQTRRLREIVEIVNVNPDGGAIINTPFSWNPKEDIFYFKKQSKVFEKIAERYGLSTEVLQKEFILRARLLYSMYQNKVFGFTEVQRIINDYYINPVAVLSRFGLG